MKKLSVVCIALGVAVSTTAAIGRGGGMGSHHGGSHHMGLHHRSMSGGALDTSAATPGTNSSGTALSSSGKGHGRMKGPPLGTNPVIDREDAKVAKMIGSICRGC
jgi:hypothetical protein